jgi:hypothetical protein
MFGYEWGKEFDLRNKGLRKCGLTDMSDLYVFTSHIPGQGARPQPVNNKIATLLWRYFAFCCKQM